MTGRVTIVAQDKKTRWPLSKLHPQRKRNHSNGRDNTSAANKCTDMIADQYRVAVNHCNVRDNTSAANKCTDTLADQRTVEDVFTTELVTYVFYIFNSTIVD